MNEQEKSLKLAEKIIDHIGIANIMGWELSISYPEGITKGIAVVTAKEGRNVTHTKEFNPYDTTETGLAQFAAILLKFPEVMRETRPIPMTQCGHTFLFDEIEPTQANILDAILRMNGVDV